MSRPAPRFVRHTGIAAPFPQPDLESELIAPVGEELRDLDAVHLDPGDVPLDAHRHDGSWTGRHAFPGFRYRPDGTEDPDFVLNHEPYREASILLAGRNFGQGSQQAFAVIRLRQCGLRVVIAPSFGPVFHDDCFDFGLLPVTLDEQVVQALTDRVRANPGIEMTVDLERQVVECPGMATAPFRIDSRRRESLLQGVDTTLLEQFRHDANAEEMRERDRRRRPWIYDDPDRREP
ncbi:MAG: 3-isopropylmalate dehydratase small subunit [Acidobacteria bacterium]|nr:3-isopropylmalate dehydratase small subunit [Acidobacteriota bacterium]MYK90003.1 3-isopropylmalate dehydratase small subunit [Acidobacteriota bacterium]